MGHIIMAMPPIGGFENIYDIDGDGELDYTVPTYEDASYGQKFDENLMVYQYNSFHPTIRALYTSNSMGSW